MKKMLKVLRTFGIMVFIMGGAMLNAQAAGKMPGDKLDVLGIEAEYVSGLATNSLGNTGRHAWNKVMFDGNWLYVDCTWDDPVSESGNVLRYDYFLLTYDEISRNHIEEQ